MGIFLLGVCLGRRRGERQSQTALFPVMLGELVAAEALVDSYRKELLGVYGIWQREGKVCHLVAKRLVDLTALLGKLNTHSRDFA